MDDYSSSNGDENENENEQKGQLTGQRRQRDKNVDDVYGDDNTAFSLIT